MPAGRETPMKRPLLAGWCLLGWAILGPVISFAGDPSPTGWEGTRPNILFILMDDMGWTDAGVLGSDFYETPRIDRLRHESMASTDAYANAPNCSPSRACLMTGLYSPRHGIYTVGSSERGRPEQRKLIPIANAPALTPAFETMAEALRRGGYQTFLGGKWNLGEGATGPEAQGFDMNVGGNDSGKPSSYFAPWHDEQLGDAPPGTHLCDYITSKVIDFMVEPRTAPFFAYISYYDVHLPREAKAELIAKYEAKLAANAAVGRPTEHGDPVYAAMLENADTNVGRLMAALDRAGFGEETLVVFFSDNGGYGEVTSMRPLRGSKGMLYEGGIRVPLFIRWPGKIAADTSCAIPVIGTDFLPTFLALSGASSSRTLDGISLLPLLAGRSADWKREAIFWHSPVYLESRPQRQGDDSRDGVWRGTPASAVRVGDWKLIEYYEAGGLELFNLRDDIGERRNLAEMNRGKAAELRARLAAWRNSTGAPIPTEINPLYRIGEK